MTVYVLAVRLHIGDTEETIIGEYSTPEAAMAAAAVYEANICKANDASGVWIGTDDDCTPDSTAHPLHEND